MDARFGHWDRFWEVWKSGLRGAAGRLFEFALPVVVTFTSPRAWAFTIMGIQEYLTSFPGDRDAQNWDQSRNSLIGNV